MGLYRSKLYLEHIYSGTMVWWKGERKRSNMGLSAVFPFNQVWISVNQSTIASALIDQQIQQIQQIQPPPWSPKKKKLAFTWLDEFATFRAAQSFESTWPHTDCPWNSPVRSLRSAQRSGLSHRSTLWYNIFPPLIDYSFLGPEPMVWHSKHQRLELPKNPRWEDRSTFSETDLLIRCVLP